MKTKKNIFSVVTEQLIEILESQKKLNYTLTWSGSLAEPLASNPVSKQTYKGFNQILLGFIAAKNGYTQNRWMGRMQGNICISLPAPL